MRERSEKSQILLMSRPPFLPSFTVLFRTLPLSPRPSPFATPAFSHLFALLCVCLIRHEAQSSLPALIYLGCRPAPSGLRARLDVFDPRAIHTRKTTATKNPPALICAGEREWLPFSHNCARGKRKRPYVLSLN